MNEENGCKQHIIKMINEVDDDGTLEYLDTFIRLFLQKWGDAK
ncbi:MAG: hypothetical protein ACI4GW_08255 [Lachnospiraceae bacterium]